MRRSRALCCRSQWAATLTASTQFLATNGAAAVVNGMLFPVLVGRNPYTGQFAPDGAMAERWEVSPDGLTYTFYLRPDVVWSDGDPLDAADFKFTYDAIASEQVDSPYKALSDNIAAIKVVDPLTIRVTFKTAALRCVDRPAIGLAAKPPICAGFQRHHGESTEHKSHCQRWTVHLPELGARREYYLAAQPRYWQGAPQIERLVFQIVADPADRFARLLSGDLDVAPLQPYQLTSAQGDRQCCRLWANTGWLRLYRPQSGEPRKSAAGCGRDRQPGRPGSASRAWRPLRAPGDRQRNRLQDNHREHLSQPGLSNRNERPAHYPMGA